MTSLIITITTPLAKQSVKDEIARGATLGRESLNGLVNYLTGVAAGYQQPATMTFAVGESNPVRASGTMTVVFASLAANDTVAVAGTTLTCVSGTASANQFQKVTDGTVTAANLAAAINASAAINRVSATSSAAVVTVTAHASGTVGNLIALTSSGAGVTLSGANLANGAGGADETPVTYTYS